MRPLLLIFINFIVLYDLLAYRLTHITGSGDMGFESRFKPNFYAYKGFFRYYATFYWFFKRGPFVFLSKQSVLRA